MKRIFGLSLPVLVLFGLMPARAALVEYDFVGHVVAFDSGPLASVLNPFPSTIDNVITGYVRFDAATAATTPGVFNLGSAVFHVQYPGITLDATTGVTATVSSLQDLIVFKATFPTGEFAPASVSSDSIALGFQTFTDNYFSLTSLPTTVPPNDHTLGFSYVSGGAPHGASTDTDLAVTSKLLAVPEPSSIGLFGSALALLAFVRYRRRRS